MPEKKAKKTRDRGKSKKQPGPEPLPKPEKPPDTVLETSLPDDDEGDEP